MASPPIRLGLVGLGGHGRRGSRTTRPETHDFSDYEGEDLIAEVEAFAESVHPRTPPETARHVGLQALAAVEAIPHSAWVGKEQIVATG